VLLTIPSTTPATLIRATRRLSVINSYRATLANDDRVLAADTNPFGVPVTIRPILGKALDQLQCQLGGA
jgi:hypothetical protein